MYSIIKFEHEGHEGIGISSKSITQATLISISNYIKNFHNNLIPRDRFFMMSDYARMKGTMLDNISYVLSEDKNIRKKIYLKYLEYKKKDESSIKRAAKEVEVYKQSINDSLYTTAPKLKKNFIKTKIEKSEIKEKDLCTLYRLDYADKKLIKKLCKGIINNTPDDKLKVLNYNDYIKYFPHINREEEMSIEYKGHTLNFKNSSEYTRSFTAIKKVGQTTYENLFKELRTESLGIFPLNISLNRNYEEKSDQPYRWISI